MAEEKTASAPAEAEPAAALDAGTYEVLSSRLADYADALAGRAESLNTARTDAFGSSELTLLGTTRIRTANNCVPRDMARVGDRLLFGYNVHMGLKSHTDVADVFALHDFSRDDLAFTEVAEPGHLLDEPRFTADFTEMYRYYRSTELLQVREVDTRLLAVFRIGEQLGDQRVLRWQRHPDGSAEYIDARGEADAVWPEAYDFEWTPTTRDHHVTGRHPHVSIEDEIFVECLGGDLTVKIEDNTETGEGVYSEPVAEPLQSLADADIAYARIGPLILLRILPYKETVTRYLVYNTRTASIVRADGIGAACRRLPEDHGIIFPGGFYLNEGKLKTFDQDTTGLRFKRVVRSPNGEDVLYVFYNEVEGRSLLLPYNVIRKEVAAPMSVHGHAVFDDGTMVAFRFTGEEATRVHPVQVWSTPFVSEAHAAAAETGDTPVHRIGNAEAVRAVSDALSVARMVREMQPGQAVFEALIATATRCLDDYPWLGDEGLFGLDESLRQVRDTAEAVLDEYATVAELTAEARKSLEQAQTDTVRLLRRARGEAPKSAEEWVALLTDLRGAGGHLVTLRETRYIDLAGIERLAADVTESLASTGRRAVAFLEREDAFTAYFEQIAGLEAKAETVATVAESTPILEELDARQRGLETLTEVVANLEIGDAVVRTAILGRVSEVLAAVNRARATLAARRRELAVGEGKAEFAAEFALLGQSVTAAISAADTPAACDEQLGRLLLTVENLETRFADFEQFMTQLADKRTDVYEAFSSRKQHLLDEAARRAEQLAASAARILEAVARRTAALSSLDEVNTYFATDPMVERLRKVIAELRGLDDTVRAEEIEGRISAARAEAGRALTDRLDLFDGDAIKFGEHRLPVNTQPLDLTLVPSGDALAFSLTGTDYRHVVDDPAFASTKPFWSQFLPSENPEVYRAEHLAAALLAEHGPAVLLAADLPRFVSAAASERYDEGYERGVHDADAAAILAEVLRLHAAAGNLRFTPECRAAARLYWVHGVPKEDQVRLSAQARSLARVRETFGSPDAMAGLVAELESELSPFLDGSRLSLHFSYKLEAPTALAAEYLAEELAGTGAFAASARARDLLAAFDRQIGPSAKAAFEQDLRALDGDLYAQWGLAWNWLDAFLRGTAAEQAGAERFDAADLPEALAIVLADADSYDVTAELVGQVTGLLGTHPRIENRVLPLRLDEFLTRTAQFRTKTLPAYRAYQRRRAEIIEAHRGTLRIEEFKPKTMAGFVRNQLIDDVYLPLIGSNLAKQIGAGSGEGRRTDQSGMLMLISPPGYGKTTLMEYVADRLGMLLVKVNGPALGHGTVSVDPADAPNATARAEVQKINFALEAGNNVLLYLDDIQHTNPELLQKFISLCDAQRKMEGVWNGRTRTYDLRGKRFAVCMAGNPYTEAGQKFRIPDMLANRADVWNLGDVLSGRDQVFAQSYIENALTSNKVTAPLATRERADTQLLIRLANGDPTADAAALRHPYSAGELDQVLSVLRKLVHLQKTVLANNLAYIASAATDDASRAEPPFLLQGSYRNMNRLTERVVPVMNEEELEAVVDDHYAGEAQTLASGAEANLLKLAELRGRLDEERAARWEAVKEGFRREQTLGGANDDPMSRAVGAITLLSDRVAGIETALQQRSSVPPR
ncbi:DNA repair ATPase [Glycomyces harbinensis]|uniref:ATPase family associated with various cellular activities (AAA) n=1 Tax=Glycomyces harbinensis TaxID=58114 RepID=A0A1G6Y1I6_9ACTN|nr:DNA repair ATPase [Glycomyces harbinensis]SDD84259.1 ATPase family associated with various cellular activities (AAA) [Glycomyces harbinensis]